MPYSQELGMRVYDPSEGARVGLEIGNTFAQAMENAKRRKLTEREIEIQERQQQRLEDEAANQARYMVRRQRGLKNMAADYESLLKVGATEQVAHRMAMMQNLPDILEGAKPEAIDSILNSGEANNVRMQMQQMMHEDRVQRLQETADYHNRLTQNQNELNLLRERGLIDQEQFRLMQGNLNVLKSQLDLQKAQTDFEHKKATEVLGAKREQRMAFQAANKDPELVKLRDVLAQAETDLRDARSKPAGWFQSQKSYDKQIAALEANRNDAAKAVDSKLKELRAQFGTEEETGSEAVTAPVQDETESTGRAGDDTLPDESKADWNPYGKYRFRTP